MRWGMSPKILRHRRKPFVSGRLWGKGCLSNGAEQAPRGRSQPNAHPPQVRLITNDLVNPAKFERREISECLGRQTSAAAIERHHFQRAALEQSKHSDNSEMSALRLDRERMRNQRARIHACNRLAAHHGALPGYRESVLLARIQIRKRAQDFCLNERVGSGRCEL